MEDRIHPGKTGMFEAERKRHEDEILLSKSPYDVTALKQQSYSTDAQAVKTQIARNPATQYLVINSRDRNQTSGLGSFTPQPWNNFKLQRPQNIMNTYATRMLVSEINFPWYCPNVNLLNNTLWVRVAGVLYTVTLKPGFRDGNSIAASLNTLFNTPGLHPSDGTISPGVTTPNGITVFYDTTVGTFTISCFNGIIPVPFQMYYQNPGAALTFPSTQLPNFITTASLAALMGFDFAQSSGSSYALFESSPTTLQYTQYIDIVSDKLHQYSTNRDGNSDTSFSRNLLCRLYLSDESSNVIEGSFVSGSGTVTTSFVQFVPGVNAPFIIHRQFKNAKAVMWNKEASVDWLDIAIYDQFGNLVPLPNIVSINPALALLPANPSYPDFNITLLASEN